MSRTVRSVPIWVQRCAARADFVDPRDGMLRVKGVDGRSLTEVADSANNGVLNKWDDTWGRYRRPKAKTRVARQIRRTTKQQDRALVAAAIVESEPDPIDIEAEAAAEAEAARIDEMFNRWPDWDDDYSDDNDPWEDDGHSSTADHDTYHPWHDNYDDAVY